MKVNTAVKMMVGAGISAAMYKMVPQVKNMVTSKMNNSPNMSSTSNMPNMSMSSSNKNSSL